MNTFADGAAAWLSRLGMLRNVIRQEMVARQLDSLLPIVGSGPLDIVDIGCGQGTQALRLAELGHRVTGVEPDEKMLGACRAAANQVGATIELVHGDAQEALRSFGPAVFDVVLCHGVIMYVDDPAPLVGVLTELAHHDGLVSIVARNADALAMRPALRGDWDQALSLFDHPGYVNELGVPARADRVEEVAALLDGAGADMIEWFGIRIFNDWVPSDTPPPSDPAELAALLDVEERGGCTDPYRRIGSQIHVIGRRRR